MRWAEGRPVRPRNRWVCVDQTVTSSRQTTISTPERRREGSGLLPGEAEVAGRRPSQRPVETVVLADGVRDDRSDVLDHRRRAPPRGGRDAPGLGLDSKRNVVGLDKTVEVAVVVGASPGDTGPAGRPGQGARDKADGLGLDPPAAGTLVPVPGAAAGRAQRRLEDLAQGLVERPGRRGEEPASGQREERPSS